MTILLNRLVQIVPIAAYYYIVVTIYHW